MGRSRRSIAQAVAVLALLSWGEQAAALVGDPGGAFGLGGSLRVAPALVYDHRVEIPAWLTTEQRALLEAELPGATVGMSQTLLRLTAAGAPARWLSYEAHLLQTLTSSSGAGDGLGLGLPAGAGAASRYRAVAGSWRWVEARSVEGRVEIDRLSVKLALPRADVTLGRQAITFGKAYFWNPLDVFLAFDPFQFDRDYKRGVDALRVDVPFGDFTGLTLVGVLGEGADGRSWYDSALLARCFTVLGGTDATLGEWDVTLQGGKVLGGFQVGGGLEGEVGQLELRAEAVGFTPDTGRVPSGAAPLPEALTVVVGAGHRFGIGLTLNAEYLFNGAGRLPIADAWPLVLGGNLLHTSRHVVGAMATWEPTALLESTLGVLVSLSDGSTVLQPGLTYSAADEVDIVAGAVIAFGEPPAIAQGAPSAPVLAYGSEFGSYPNVFYLEVKAYF